MEEAGAGLAQAVQDAGQGGVQVEEGADEGQGADVGSCGGAFEQEGAYGFSKQEEKCAAHGAQKEAETAGL